MEMAQGPASQGGGQAQVRFGVYTKSGSHAGKTVKQVRDAHSKLWGIPGEANAYKGTEKLDENYVIQEGDSIEFKLWDSLV